MATEPTQDDRTKYENAFSKIPRIIKASNILCESDFEGTGIDYKDFETKLNDLKNSFENKFKIIKYDASLFEILNNKALPISTIISTNDKLNAKVCTEFGILGNNCLESMGVAKTKNPTVSCELPAAVGGKKRQSKRQQKTGKKHRRQSRKSRKHRR